jgi:hypothetical protein
MLSDSFIVVSIHILWWRSADLYHVLSYMAPSTVYDAPAGRPKEDRLTLALNSYFSSSLAALYLHSSFDRCIACRDPSLLVHCSDNTLKLLLWLAPNLSHYPFSIVFCKIHFFFYIDVLILRFNFLFYPYDSSAFVSNTKLWGIPPLLTCFSDFTELRSIKWQALSFLSYSHARLRSRHSATGSFNYPIF